MTSAAPRMRAVTLGLRANLAQFSLLVGVNALVGGMLGQERTVLPLLATHGVVADVYGLVAAIWVVAVVTLVGAAIVAVRMYETHPIGRWSTTTGPWPQWEE